uniref:Uncharacterized protein n=1 Tax=Apteryx owenii TaxID=8824 RepID=A0A8B9NTW3_APTOW
MLPFIIYCLIRDSHRVRDPSGKYIFITSCDTGLGNSLAKWLDKRGFHVTASCCSLSVKTVNLNLADSSSISRAVLFVTEETAGKGKFSILE